jgi:hypothetical protein
MKRLALLLAALLPLALAAPSMALLGMVRKEIYLTANSLPEFSYPQDCLRFDAEERVCVLAHWRAASVVDGSDRWLEALTRVARKQSDSTATFRRITAPRLTDTGRRGTPQNRWASYRIRRESKNFVPVEIEVIQYIEWQDDFGSFGQIAFRIR